MKITGIMAVGLCAILLAACAASVSPAAPSPLPSAAPSVTPTLSATPTPSATPTVTPTPTPIPTSAAPQIAFASNRDGNWNLYRVKLDGKGLTQLTLDKGDEINPAWSPDGLRLVYQLKQGEHWQVMRMNWDGGEISQLTGQGSNQNPVWAPDGQQILFDSDRGGNRDIYQMDADGGNQQALTQLPANEFAPAWAPDGSAIAYLSDQDATQEECTQNVAEACPQEIFLMDAKGGFLRKVVGLKAQIGGVVWAPDSQRLAALVAQFAKSEITLYDMQTRKLTAAIDLAGLLASVYSTGPGNLYLRSYAFSPKGNNAVFCARQDITSRSGLRSLFSGCYLVATDGSVLFALAREEVIAISDSDLKKAVDYGYAVWQP